MKWMRLNDVIIGDLPNNRVVLTMMGNGRMFAYNISQGIKGLCEVQKHHPESLCTIITKPESESPPVEAAAVQEVWVEQKVEREQLVKGDKLFFFPSNGENEIVEFVEERGYGLGVIDSKGQSVVLSASNCCKVIPAKKLSTLPQQDSGYWQGLIKFVRNLGYMNGTKPQYQFTEQEIFDSFKQQRGE